jgi:hypothetical protein
LFVVKYQDNIEHYEYTEYCKSGLISCHFCYYF